MSTKVRKSKPAAKVSKKPATKSSVVVPFKKQYITSIVLYLLLAIAAVVFMKNTSYQLTIGYLAKDTLLSNQAGHTVLGPAAHAVWSLQLRYAVAAIMVLSAVVPILYLTKLRDKYQQSLSNKVSAWRWIDFGVTIALITEVVALVSGLSDIPTLKIVALLISVTCLLGYFAEKQGASKKLSTHYIVSLITGTLPWLIIIPYAVATILYGMLVAPWWTYALYVTTFIAAFGIAKTQYNASLQRGRAKDYNYVEKRYLTFSMFGKVAFALILILGLLK